MTSTVQAAITVAGTAVVLAQYPTPAGATVELTDLGPDTHWRYTSRCTGCPHKDGYRTTDNAHRYARAHAKKCYEQPAEDSDTLTSDRPAAQLPTTPDAPADRILTGGDADLLDDLTAQIGGRNARRILAEAYSIASARLWDS